MSYRVAHAPALLDLIEEPLDQIAVPIDVEAEADRVLTIAPGRDVRPRALFGDQCPDPVGVVPTICQQPRMPGRSGGTFPANVAVPMRNYPQ